MKRIKILNTTPNAEPKFLKTTVINYEVDGKPHKWEQLISHDSVHILVNNVDTQKLLLVKQTRIPVLFNQNIEFTYECCAGLIDKLDKSVLAIAKEEIHEELGYDAHLIENIETILSSVGSSGNNLHLFYAEVKNKDFIGVKPGEQENITTVELPYARIRDFLINCKATDTTTKYLLSWFLMNRI